MNKMNVVGLLVLIATLPACDYCCRNQAAAPVEEVAVVQQDVTADQAAAPVAELEVGDVEAMVDLEDSK